MIELLAPSKFGHRLSHLDAFPIRSILISEELFVELKVPNVICPCAKKNYLCNVPFFKKRLSITALTVKYTYKVLHKVSKLLGAGLLSLRPLSPLDYTRKQREIY